MSALQPVGIFAFPAGLMLLPDDVPDDARAAWERGMHPDPWPESMRLHRAALQSTNPDPPSIGGAAPAGSSGVEAYNAWVLNPEGDDVPTFDLPADVAAMVNIVAYTQGQTDVAPSDDPAAQPNVRALIAASQASAALETGDGATAWERLRQAATIAETPALQGVLLANLGGMGPVHPNANPARDLADAQTLLEESDLYATRAEIHAHRGQLAHAAAASAGTPLTESMQHYYSGLRLVSEESSPYVWGILQLNLAAAQLATPMNQASDQLRLGVATQALRSCLRIFTVEQYPAEWSSATLNLANALVYTPSVHQGDNIVEAVELYEQVLTSGVRDDDPLGRARLLANQGNALAHLGIFDQAKSKLVEARFLFEEHLDHEGAMAVRQVLDEISRAGVHDPDANLAGLAHQAEQMSRMPEQDFTQSGMGVRFDAVREAQKRAKVTRLKPEEETDR